MKNFLSLTLVLLTAGWANAHGGASFRIVTPFVPSVRIHGYGFNSFSSGYGSSGYGFNSFAIAPSCHYSIRSYSLAAPNYDVPPLVERATVTENITPALPPADPVCPPYTANAFAAITPFYGYSNAFAFHARYGVGSRLIVRQVSRGATVQVKARGARVALRKRAVVGKRAVGKRAGGKRKVVRRR